MKRSQRGEAMLAVMVVMLTLVWLGSGHVNMMGSGHGGDHQVKNADQAAAQAQAASPAASAPQGSQGHRH